MDPLLISGPLFAPPSPRGIAKHPPLPGGAATGHLYEGQGIGEAFVKLSRTRRPPDIVSLLPSLTETR